MVRGRAKPFLAGPPLLKAATGEIATDEELGGAEMHSIVSGSSEYLADDNAHAIGVARDLVGKLPWKQASMRLPDGMPPRAALDELHGVMLFDAKKIRRYARGHRAHRRRFGFSRI